MPYKNAYIYAIKLLTKQSYSEYKLRSKLLEHYFQKEEVDSAIQQIKLNSSNQNTDKILRYLFSKGMKYTHVKKF